MPRKEPMAVESEDIIDCMARMKGDQQPFALATVVRTEDATSAKAGAKAIVRADGSFIGWIGGGCTQGAVRKTAAQALADGRARFICVHPDAPDGSGEDVEEYKNACLSGGTIEVFVEPILPRPQLFVLGASQTARALCDLGRGLGFAVTLAALPDDLAQIAGVDAAIEGFDLAGNSQAAKGYVVVATQGKRDREALESALVCGAPYVAFIGSRKKMAQLKEQLAARGVDPESLGALRSPAGLDIGAVTPEEIALSILAEIVQERRKDAAAGAREDVTVEGATVETRVVEPAAGGCCGEGGKH